MEAVAEIDVSRGSDRAESSFRPVVVVTVALVTVTGDKLQILLAPRSSGAWALPSASLDGDVSLDGAAQAEVQRLVGTPPSFVDQLFAANVHPVGSTAGQLEVSYLAVVRGRSGARPGAMLPGGYQWWPVSQCPALSPEHRQVLTRAHDRLQARLLDTRIAEHLLPDEFTLTDLQQIYETIQGRALDKRNFRKWILASGFVECTDHQRRDGAHRPARLYRFTHSE